MNIICISGKARHGKDTTADMLRCCIEDDGKSVLIAHYGDLVKYVCKMFFAWDGNKDEHGRTLLQYVGTNRVRAQRPDYWVDFVRSIVEMFPDKWDYVLIPDCRFPNEYELFANGGFRTYHIRVNRPGFDSGLTEGQKNHPSETALDDYPADSTIVNDSTLDELRKKIEREYNKIKGWEENYDR